MVVLVKKSSSRVVRWVKQISKKNWTSCHWYEVDHCGIG